MTLEVAHKKGIVHRDIKPANVLATRDGRTVLVDFGIAKILRADEFAAELPATVPGLTALTPDYASPEQIRGQQIGVASDVYSLGILLYELLTGSRPYTTYSLSPGEIERSVCETIPPDPSSRVAMMRATPPVGLDDKRRLRGKLRGDLDRIVMTSCASNRNNATRAQHRSLRISGDTWRACRSRHAERHGSIGRANTLHDIASPWLRPPLRLWH